eukprot:2864649-Pyramimonas_sp.AAC.1
MSFRGSARASRASSGPRFPHHFSSAPSAPPPWGDGSGCPAPSPEVRVTCLSRCACRAPVSRWVTA